MDCLPRVTRLVAIVCALTLLPGCSFLFVEHAPPEHAHRTDFTCTTSQAAPIADTAVAAMFGGLGGLWVVSGAGCDSSAETCSFADVAIMLGAALLVPAVLTGVSAISGFTATAECDAALDARSRDHAVDEPDVADEGRDPAVGLPRRGANGALEYTFAMTGVRVDLRAIVGNTERVQVALSRLVAADRVSHTPCDTWSIVAGDNTTSVPGGLYRATREAAGQRETFVNNVPIAALRQFVDGNAQGLAAIDLCRERLYLSMAIRNELARFFEELDAMLRERAASPAPIAPMEPAPGNPDPGSRVDLR